MSPALRTAVMYVVANAHRNVYVMTYAAQLKSIHRSRPAAESILPQIVLEGRHLTELEVTALDFAQEISSPNAFVSEGTRKRLLDVHPQSDGRLERLVSATAAYAAFMSCLTSLVDLQLTHPAIQYASNNLQGLPWKTSAAPINVAFHHDEITDFASDARPGASSKYRPKRERLSLTRNYDRHVDRTSSSRSRPRAIRRVSQFFTSSLMGPRTVSDVNRVTENWMRMAGVPPAGQLFDMNDEIYSIFGFHPYYFSTAAMEGEATRRAFLFGAKELLFGEREIPKRLKFIICYVISSGKERRRILNSEHSRSFEAQGVHNGHSITSVYSQRTYDSLSIMSAHAAFVACKYGAKPCELVAASDASRVRSAMDRYSKQASHNMSSRSVSFPLTRRECAAVLVAHALLKETPRIDAPDLMAFEKSFRMSVKGIDQGNRPSRRALLEIIGTASMWSAFERYAAATLAFDIDCTSNMVFGTGRAEPTIIEFCRSDNGRKIGLSLVANESRDGNRVRSDSRASRTSSLRPNMKTSNHIYRKRTSSALHSSNRVGRMFGCNHSEIQSDFSSIAAS